MECWGAPRFAGRVREMLASPPARHRHLPLHCTVRCGAFAWAVRPGRRQGVERGRKTAHQSDPGSAISAATKLALKRNALLAPAFPSPPSVALRRRVAARSPIKRLDVTAAGVFTGLDPFRKSEKRGRTGTDVDPISNSGQSRSSRRARLRAQWDVVDLTSELQKIYDSEINLRIAWLWDGGIEVRLGDEMNGFLAEENVRSVPEIVPWLQEAIAHFLPDLILRQILKP